MAKDKLKVYKVVADDSDIYAMSVVECPANEQSFVMFSKDEPKKHMVCFESDLKHNIMGVALIPDQKIYRNFDGEEFYITFDADTIEKLAHKFLKNGGNLYMTKDHETYAEGLSVAESWIKTSENDKSVDYGIDAPIGSWILTCHCDSLELWDSFKEGKRTGFSIESFVQLEEIIEKKDNNMNKETKLETMEVNDSFWDKLKGIIAEAVGTSKEDEVVEEAVEEAKEVAEEEAPAVEEEMAEETPSEETPQEIAEEVAEVVEENAEDAEEAAEDLQAVVDELKAEIDSLKAENEELKKKNQKMSKMPSTKVVNKQSADNKNPRDIIEAIYNGTYFK